MTITTETKLGEILETEVCGRCGGTGQYSFNQIDGSRCYGCGGSGRRYTKRGQAALNYLNWLREAPVDQVHPGDVVLAATGPGPSKWMTVAEVEQGERGPTLTFKNGFRCGYRAESTVAVAVKAMRLPVYKAVAAYQESLTKKGEPRKRVAA